MQEKISSSMCKESNNSFGEESLKLNEEMGGLLEVHGKIELNSIEALSIAYTPGVAEPCRKIAENGLEAYKYTLKKNTVAVITDGSAVLGLGNIGAQAALPVMAGKALIFKEFANIDAFPICIDTNAVEEVISTIKHISPTFGGINLEDISAPRCFVIEERLRKELPIPVFHDDQHGTAIVTIAALINALKIVNKKLENIKIVISGAGAAGMAITKKLLHIGVRPSDLLVCDRNGIIFKGRTEGMNFEKEELSLISNSDMLSGNLADALMGADVFIGVSAPGILREEMISSMAKDPIIFAMANPIPEIMPLNAKKAGAKIIATGRSDCPNQVNNCLGFPGIFRGALDVRASDITLNMEMAAINALADMLDESELDVNYIIPDPLDKRVVGAISSAVARAAIEDGVSRI